MDDMFNPTEYTEKELLKLVYRELHNLRAEFDEYRKNNDFQKQLIEVNKSLAQIETEQKIQKEVQIQSDKKNQKVLTYVGIGVTILTIVLKFINI